MGGVGKKNSRCLGFFSSATGAMRLIDMVIAGARNRDGKR